MEAHSPETWRTTELWKQLEARKGAPADRLRHIAESILPDAEKVLNKGDTMPGNFTLHDADHSYRVATWMAEIAGDLLDELSPFDLSMLLLSAYLHDIGMTPKLGRLKAHYYFLLSGEPGELSEEEVEQLQEWLDDEWEGIEAPFADERPDAEDLRFTDQVLAGYIRHRHNDWSEDWMREEAPSRVEQPYPGWLDDLVRVCRSHHYGIDQLKAADFDPRLVGAPANVLHLRYCACLLRVADVIDFDPERTPPILFAHRDVEGESVIFWHKDQGISMLKVDDHLMLDARPGDAVTHHAIATTVAGIDRELLLVRRLDDETDFHNMNGKRDLPHRWTLDTRVKAVIAPRDNAYEYVNGTFRPDANRLLELVGGVELYGSDLAAVRELLQNAFDAVREQIALQRLGEDEPASEEARDKIAAVHKVTLTLERTAEGLRLTCRDTGIGMSREIVSNRFLVGGTTAGHETRALERDCQARGFSVGRTARFGIGVLSYFLLADKMVVRTRRSQEARDPDGTGWRFTTLGLTDFGELRRDRECGTGTTVELDLAAMTSDDDFARDLRDYLAQTVRRTPCAFSFVAPDFDLPPLKCEGGWVADTDYLKEVITEADWIDSEVTETLDLDAHLGELPDGLGTFRISFGTFPLPPGPSVAFMKLEADGNGSYSVEPFEEGHGMVPEYGLVHSWNGMEIRPEMGALPSGWMEEFRILEASEYPAYVEIDWSDDRAGALAISRNAFRASESVMAALRFVKERLKQIVEEFLIANGDSPLALLNAQLLDRLPAGLDIEPHWLLDGRDELGRRVLGRLRQPLITPIEDVDADGERWRGKEVSPTPKLSIKSASYGFDLYNWFGPFFNPQFVAARGDGERIQPVVVWERFEVGADRTSKDRFRVAEFPPVWERLVGIDTLDESVGEVVWNANHPLVLATDDDARKWVRERFAEEGIGSFEFGPNRDALLDSPSLLAAWFLSCLEREDEKTWNRLEGSDREFVEAIWRTFPGLNEQIVYIDFGYAIEQLHTIMASTWTTRRAEHLGRRLIETLGTPDEEWRLAPADPSHRRG